MDSSRLRFLDAEAFYRGPKDRGFGQRARSVSGTRLMGKVSQITDGPYISHPSYFLHSSFFPGGRSMFFTSYRSGSAQVWQASLDTGETQQLTHGAPIHPYSPVLHPDGHSIVVTRGGGLWIADRCIFEAKGAEFGECSI